ncbi:UNVERIFIED_CONTAM: hypothetical protein GTU68_036602 [Idotea baltica]|nr:hypothetical protein [Idotea baltica]
MDGHVIDLPWLLRRLLVSIIVRKRSVSSAAAYASVWTERGSPLVVFSQKLQQAMQAKCSTSEIALAMRYGSLSIESTVDVLYKKGIKKITLVPLYPHFADSTVTTVIEVFEQIVKKKKLSIDYKVVPPFFDHPAYISALAESATLSLAKDFDHLLLSFHGLPERHITLSECYRAQCIRSSSLLAKSLNLNKSQWSVSFQSRLGRAKWIEPYTEEVLNSLAQQGVNKLLVMCPAFTADCLETLEEIGDRGRELFLASGGESFQLIPCLNDHPVWVDSLIEICDI